MPTVGTIDHLLRAGARGVTGLVKWADYQSGTRPEPTGRPARLTYYSSGSGDAGAEGLDLLDVG
jgi:hypothetical protein